MSVLHGAVGALSWAIVEVGMAKPLIMYWIATQSTVNNGLQCWPGIGDTLLHHHHLRDGVFGVVKTIIVCTPLGHCIPAYFQRE